MQKKMTKSTLLITAFLLTAFIVPNIATVNAETASASAGPMGGLDPSNPDTPAALAAGLGQAFSGLSILGPSGAALGQVFSLLFSNFANMTRFESNFKDGVLALNASYTDEYATWTESGDRNERYYLYRDNYDSVTGMTESMWPYIDVERTGTATMTYTAGASIVFIMWDNDESLITAINKIYEAYYEIYNLLDELPDDDSTWTDAQTANFATQVAGVLFEAITYFLFHINDIINGDELIITNIMTWEDWQMETSSDYETNVSIEAWDAQQGQTVDFNAEEAEFIAAADAADDEYAKYLLTESDNFDGLQSKSWSTFSFNLIELWLKNFEIHINASLIADIVAFHASDGQIGTPYDPNTTPAQIFQGMDIDFYIITHSLMAWAAFDDTLIEENYVPDATYTTVIDSNGDEQRIINNTELLYWYGLENYGSATFNKPSVVNVYDELGNLQGEGLKWSLRMEDVNVKPVPIGNTADEATGVSENLAFIEMGFTFLPLEDLAVDTEGFDEVGTGVEEVQMGAGIIKLDQYFGEWNSGAGMNNAFLDDLDFAVLFISTIFHFQFNLEIDDVPEDLQQEAIENTNGILNESDYSEEGTIKVGDQETNLPVAAVDIAGPQYQQTHSGTTTSYDAATTTIPLAYLNYNMNAQCTYFDSESPNQSFSAEASLTLDLSIMIYAVSYGTFNGSGDQIWHDPTFSVFMDWEAPGFWAVILVIGSVTLVAVAAIMITKRKNSRV